MSGSAVREARGHSEFCAFLSVAKSAVQSGLYDAAARILPDLRDPSPMAVMRVLLRAVRCRQDVLLSAARRMCSEIRSGCKSGFQEPRVSAPAPCALLDRCAVDTGSHGRSLRAVCAIPTGHVVLRDVSAACAPAYPCGCSAEGTLMAEHVQLAWALVREEALVKAEGRHMNPQLPAIDTLCSGCEGSYSADGAAGANRWSLRTALTMLVASYVCSAICRPDEQSGSISLRMFDILSRLPQNTHGVDSVQSEPSVAGGVVVSQRRVGLSLFVAAAAANHSCDPNCCVKHLLEEDGQSGGARIIEIISIRKIRPGEELTISYGMSATRHSRRHRRGMLQAQYLFHCQCPACGDTDDLAALGSSSSGTEAALIGMVARIDRAIGLVRAGLGSGPEVEADLAGMWALLKERSDTECFDSEHWKIRIVQLHSNYLDTVGFVLAAQQQFGEAAQTVQCALNLLLQHGVYRDTDVTVGRELVKLSELHTAANQSTEAWKCACRAFKCLNGFISREDPDFLSLVCAFPVLLEMK